MARMAQVLQQEMPEVYAELLDNVTKLELHYKDLQVRVQD